MPCPTRLKKPSIKRLPTARVFLTLLLTLFLLAACSFQADTETPTLPSSPTQTQTATETLTSTSTPEPTQTDTPTATPTEVVIQICSPLQDHPMDEVLRYISNPYYEDPSSNEELPHHGIDISYLYREGTKDTILGVGVQAVLSGRVAAVVSNRDPYGNMILIETPYEGIPTGLFDKMEIAPGTSLYLLYAHNLDTPTQAIGEQIACGQLINHIGDTGFSGDPHVHIETRLGPAGMSFPEGMAFYFSTTTENERENYVLWRTSGTFVKFDPVILLSLPQP